MPSKKAAAQAILWLKNIAAEKDSLDAVNAEIVLTVISDLQKQNTRKGAIIHNLKHRLNEEDIPEQDEYEQLEIRLE